MMPAQLQRVTLTGVHVRLEPLTMAHFEGLAKVSADPETWYFMGFGNLAAPDRLYTWLQEVASEPEQGVRLPFAIIDRHSGRVTGCSSLYDVQPRHRRLELGRTWLGPEYRRTGINTDCKLLLLEHAFEGLGMRRVQLKASLGNIVSRTTIERLGASFAGVLRSYSVLPDGTSTDTAMYSILAAAWPRVRAHLLLLRQRMTVTPLRVIDR